MSAFVASQQIIKSQAVNLRHLHVREHQVRLYRADNLHSPCAICLDYNLIIAQVAQYEGAQLSSIWVVINYYNCPGIVASVGCFGRLGAHKHWS